MFHRCAAVAAALAPLLSCLLASPAAAAPRFEGWAPLGSYERLALQEGAAFRMAVPTRKRVVELSLRPNQVKSPRYHALRLDRKGRGTGVRGPKVATYAASLGSEPGSKGGFARLSFEPREQRVSGLMRVDGILYELSAQLARGDLVAQVREITAEELAELFHDCALALDAGLADGSGAAETSSATGEGTSGLREIELGTEADAAFVGQMGSVAAANARILAVVNLVNGIYESDLGLTNRVVVQRAWSGSDPYSSSDAYTLLSEFSKDFSRKVSTPHDDGQLFSGRDFDSNYIGRAYVSAICGDSSYAVNQAYSFADSKLSLIVAHEEGHNLGGSHVSDGVMASSLGAISPYFSPDSQTQIAAKVDSVTCLEPPAGGGAPSLDPVGPQAVGEVERLEIQLVASDPDGDPLTFRASPLLPGASIDPSGLFRYEPPLDTVGCSATEELLVELSVTDGAYTASEIVPISVSDLPTGATPALSDPADRSVEPGRTVGIQLQASDADGDALVFSALGMPQGATLSPSGAFSWTPDAGAIGTTTIRFEATDCTGRSAGQDVAIEVKDVVPPHLDSLGPNSGSHRSEVVISGRDFLGEAVEVYFGAKRGSVRQLADGEIRVSVPKPPKGTSAVEVRVVRDGTPSDNSLAFTYTSGGSGRGKGKPKK